MQGNIFVISAASGTGKTTLIARLLQHHSDIRVSVSHTTRAPMQPKHNTAPRAAARKTANTTTSSACPNSNA